MENQNFSDIDMMGNETDEFAGVFDACYHVPPLVFAVVIIGLNGWVLYLVKPARVSNQT